MLVRKARSYTSDHRLCAAHPLDFLDTGEHFLRLFDLHGVPTEGVNIAVHEGNVNGAGRPRANALCGSKASSLRDPTGYLPAHLAEMDRAGAHLENSGLSVRVPKRRPRRWRQIPVREAP